jgi:hypothetical protein
MISLSAAGAILRKLQQVFFMNRRIILDCSNGRIKFHIRVNLENRWLLFEIKVLKDVSPIQLSTYPPITLPRTHPTQYVYISYGRDFAEFRCDLVESV